MGHSHIQRLKTKLLETNEKLEERDRCIASLRAQCAHDDEERERLTTALRNETEQQLASVEARNALQETMMREREEVELGHAELEEEIRWLRGVENENKVEIRLLRGRVEEVMGTVTTLKRDNARRTRVEYNTKRSVLRSFKWNISRVDPDLFRVATAFWGATQDNSEILGRTTKEMRKKTLKALIKQCFDGELYVEIEKEIMKKVRFKVWKLARLSDLESKFNADAVGSIAHAQEGLKNIYARPPTE